MQIAETGASTTVLLMEEEEILQAIDQYLATRGIRIDGPRTVRVSDRIVDGCQIVVDQGGKVLSCPVQ